MESIGKIIKLKSLKGNQRNKYEYQAFGNSLAEELGDTKHRALYIKLAKNDDRSLLEQARDYVLGNENATTKGRLFMWKLSQLKEKKGIVSKKKPGKTKKSTLEKPAN